MDGALQKIREKNFFPAVCGRICSAPCEKACVYFEQGFPIGIRALERFAADYGYRKVSKEPFKRSGKKAAVIGSGPTGLSAAVELAQKDYQVTIFESHHQPGGVLRYGIPEFRLPKKILEEEIRLIQSLGVKIITNCLIGQTMTFEEIFKQEFAVVLLALGAGGPRYLDIPGTSLGGVYYGEEYLMRVHLRRSSGSPKEPTALTVGRKVAVIGSGNTALDCARSCVRLGKEVSLIFRRTEEEMFVHKEDRRLAKEEGVKLESLTRVLEIVPNVNNFVTGLKCLRLDYADPEEKNKWTLTPINGSEFILDVDTVIIAVGHKTNSLMRRLLPDLRFNEDETVWVDGRSMTSISKIFAAGNVALGATPVVEAMVSGKRAAQHMDEFLRPN